MTTASRPVVRAMFPGMFLGGLVILVMVLMGDSRLVGNHFLAFKWQYFLIAIGFDVLNRVFKFLKHSFYLNQSGVRRLTFARRITLFLSSSPLSAASLHTGESYKSIWLSKTSGIPINRADSIYLIERFSDALSVFILALLGSFAFPSSWPFFLVLFIVFLAAIITLQIKPAMNSLLNAGDHFPNMRVFVQDLREIVDGNPRAFTFSSMTLSITLGVLSWLAHGAALFYILVGLGLLPSLALIATCCLVLSFAKLMGLVSNLPGGLGVIELAMAALLTILLDFNPELAVTATILFRLATFWISLLFGILFWSVAGQTLGLKTGVGRIVKS